MRSKALGLMIAPLLVALVANCSGSPPLTPLPPVPPSATPVASSAASSAAWVPAVDAPFRQQAPAAAPETAWTAPLPSEQRLSNGMHVLLVERTQLPIVAVQVVTRRGADQQRNLGVGSFAGRMLEQGTKTRTALQVSDDYDAIGAQHGAYVTWDSGGAWMKVLPQSLDKGLEILGDIIQNPAFSAEEVERVRSQQLATWRQMLDSPQALLSRTTARTLYANHAYGSILLGDEDALKKLSRQDLVAFYNATFVPSETAIVVVGNTKAAELIPKLEKVFGGWKKAAPALRKVPTAPAVHREIVLVDQPGAPQSNIAVAGIGVDRSVKDRDAIDVANTLFGGMFSSRLNLNLREKHAFTYGARSRFDMRHGAGPVTSWAAVDTPNTGAALREILNELQGFCREDVTQDELGRALGQIVKSMPGDFEGAQSTASQVADLWVYGYALDEYRTVAARVGQVTPAEVRRVAADRMSPANAVIVVVGDRKVVLPQLVDLAFGGIKIVDKQGKVLEAVEGKSPAIDLACRPAAASPGPAGRR